MTAALERAGHADRFTVLTIWERVMKSDTDPPIEATLARAAVSAQQFWDPDRVVSKAMGEIEGNEKSIVWDCVYLYPPGSYWAEGAASRPPPHRFTARPVTDEKDRFEEALRAALQAH